MIRLIASSLCLLEKSSFTNSFRFYTGHFFLFAISTLKGFIKSGSHFDWLKDIPSDWWNERMAVILNIIQLNVFDPNSFCEFSGSSSPIQPAFLVPTLKKRLSRRLRELLPKRNSYKYKTGQKLVVFHLYLLSIN